MRRSRDWETNEDGVSHGIVSTLRHRDKVQTNLEMERSNGWESMKDDETEAE